MSKLKLQTAAAPAQRGSFRASVPFEELNALGGFSLYRSNDEQRLPGDYNILCSQKALNDVFDHLGEDTKREHGGLLLGYETGSGEGIVPTVVVTHALRGNKTSGTPTSLTFALETWAEWDRSQDEIRRLGIDLKRVGWYHSHPNIEIFLSRYDLDVCTTFERLRCPVALVYDPIRNRGGFFVRGTEGYRPHSPQGFWCLTDQQDGKAISWENAAKVAPAVQAAALPAVDKELKPEAPPSVAVVQPQILPVAPGTNAPSPVHGSTTVLLGNLGKLAAAVVVVIATLFTAGSVWFLRGNMKALVADVKTLDTEVKRLATAAVKPQPQASSAVVASAGNTGSGTTGSTAGTSSSGPNTSTAANTATRQTVSPSTNASRGTNENAVTAKTTANGKKTGAQAARSSTNGKNSKTSKDTKKVDAKSGNTEQGRQTQNDSKPTETKTTAGTPQSAGEQGKTATTTSEDPAKASVPQPKSDPN